MTSRSSKRRTASPGTSSPSGAAPRSSRWTARKQVAEFDEGHFFDAGAWRIPYSHRALLHYCKEFNIPLIPHKNKNQNAYTYLDSQGKKMRNREWLTDMQGYTSELLAKAVDQNNLDMEMSDEDAQMLLDYIVSAGFISSDDLTYSGSSRRGYAELPGGGMNPGEPSEPVPGSRNSCRLEARRCRQPATTWR
ncbi:MAG: FAD-dependent oxidoreductase [Thermomicrobiales bacterium]